MLTDSNVTYHPPKAIDADFKDVTEEEMLRDKEREMSSKLPALLHSSSPIVSRLMANTEASERLIHEAELNEKLGLETQTRLNYGDALHEELTKSITEYPEVDEAGLEKLFGINLMMWKIRFHNFVQILKPIAIVMIPLILDIIMFNLMPIVIENNQGLALSPVWRDLLEVIGTIVGGIFTIMAFAGSLPVEGNDMADMCPRKLRMNMFKLFLAKENVKDTSVKIIYGAKLRLAEAMEKGIFSSYTIYHPEIAKMVIKRPPPRVDPAIVGNISINNVNRMFLISCWDIDKDRDRVVNDFKRMKSLKVKA